MTTGMIGLGIYLFFMGSLFYFGLKGLGYSGTNRDRSFLLMMMTFGGIAGIFFPKWIEGTYRLSGVGLPLGILLGGVLYLILCETLSCPREKNPINLKRPWLFIGLFSALVGHLIEIQFGIAVAVTRFHFWVYLAVFVLLGLGWIGRHPEQRRPGIQPFQPMFFLDATLLYWQVRF